VPACQACAPCSIAIVRKTPGGFAMTPAYRGGEEELSAGLGEPGFSYERRSEATKDPVCPSASWPPRRRTPLFDNTYPADGSPAAADGAGRVLPRILPAPARQSSRANPDGAGEPVRSLRFASRRLQPWQLPGGLILSPPARWSRCEPPRPSLRPLASSGGGGEVQWCEERAPVPAERHACLRRDFPSGGCRDSPRQLAVPQEACREPAGTEGASSAATCGKLLHG